MKQLKQQDRFLRTLIISSVAVLLLVTMWSWTNVWASSSGDDDREAYGHIDSFPAGFSGIWVVNGVTYQANGSTEFKQEEGPFAVGRCVKIHYFDTTSPFTIREVETENDSICGSDPTETPNASTTPDGTETPDASATPSVTITATPSSTSEGERKITGIVDSLPSPGLVGTWVIDGVEYMANGSTEFKQKDGPFMVGACAKVEFFGLSAPLIIKEIETEELHDCHNNATSTPSFTGTPQSSSTPDATGVPSGESEIYGLLQSFPEGLVGNWNVGGLTFVADANTEFKQENGAFAVGTTVKVHFSVEDGVNRAREIETKFENDNDGNDDDHNGSFEGAEGHAFSTVDSIPANRTGQWVIGGIEYTTNSNTEFEEENGSLTVGVKVKVEYYLDAGNNRIVKEMQTTGDDGGSSASDHFKLFGFVNQMPPNALVGTWMVDNIAFTTDNNTQFKETNGLFALGTFVEVEYFIKDGRHLIHEIETHVPPGAGDNTEIGKIDSRDNVRAAQISAGLWVIGGRTYIVTSATNLNKAGGAIAVGEIVVVNSYTVPNGSEVATQIRGITLNHTVLLPLVAR